MAGQSPKPGRRRSTRTDHVVRQVKNYIFSNGLKPGDRIPGEYDLARVLKVSRPTLREAIKGLSVSGLLESRPRIGTRVREFTYDQVTDALVAHFHLSNLDLREILEARSALELATMPYVVERAAPADVEEMRAIELEFERATRAGWDHLSLDLKLHAKFLEASGNRLLANMVGLLQAFFAHPRLDEMIVQRHFDEAEQQRTIQEHQIMIEAISHRDVSRAVATLRDHFDRQLEWLATNEKSPGNSGSAEAGDQAVEGGRHEAESDSSQVA